MIMNLNSYFAVCLKGGKSDSFFSKVLISGSFGNVTWGFLEVEQKVIIRGTISNCTHSLHHGSVISDCNMVNW